MQLLTEGHKLLRAWLQGAGRSQTALAKRLGVTQGAVALWIKPGHRPAEHHRAALELVTSIPATAWLTKKERALLERLAKPAEATP